jgi:hypothetical protein
LGVLRHHRQRAPADGTGGTQDRQAFHEVGAILSRGRPTRRVRTNEAGRQGFC